jgi:hypothetical protein
MSIDPSATVGTDLVAVAGRFSIPYLVRLLQRRYVFTLGTLSLAASKFCRH